MTLLRIGRKFKMQFQDRSKSPCETAKNTLDWMHRSTGVMRRSVKTTQNRFSFILHRDTFYHWGDWGMLQACRDWWVTYCHLSNIISVVYTPLPSPPHLKKIPICPSSTESSKMIYLGLFFFYITHKKMASKHISYPFCISADCCYIRAFTVLAQI